MTPAVNRVPRPLRRSNLFACSLLLGMACSQDRPPTDDSAPFDASDSSAPTNVSPDTDSENTDSEDTDSDTASEDTDTNSAAHTSSEANHSDTDSDTGSENTASDTAGDASSEPPAVPVPQIAGCPVFPADSPWNTDVSALPVHPNSDDFVDSVGREAALHPDFGTEWQGAPIGIPYVTVDAAQPTVAITYTAYGDESDPGPMPIPLDAPIEGGPDGDGDRHTLVVDRSTCTLYELYRAFPTPSGFEADSGTVWDLRSNEHHPEGCTSADAAGLPIFPGLVRYEELVEQGEVRHALRFTVSRTQRAYVFPARHYASADPDPSLPPMGLRFRMKASYDCSAYSNEVQILCRAMKRYGLIVADNGSNWYVSGAPDPRFSDDNLGDFKRITGDAFEVVDTGAPIVTAAPSCTL